MSAVNAGDKLVQSSEQTPMHSRTGLNTCTEKERDKRTWSCIPKKRRKRDGVRWRGVGGCSSGARQHLNSRQLTTLAHTLSVVCMCVKRKVTFILLFDQHYHKLTGTHIQHTLHKRGHLIDFHCFRARQAHNISPSLKSPSLNLTQTCWCVYLNYSNTSVCMYVCARSYHYRSCRCYTESGSWQCRHCKLPVFLSPNTHACTHGERRAAFFHISLNFIRFKHTQ